MLKKFIKSPAASTSAFLVAVSLSGIANAATLNQLDVKNAFLKNCMGNGGDKNVCACSYDKSLQVMTLTDLANYNVAIANGQTNIRQVGQVRQISENCAQQYHPTADDNTALPPPPPPPVADLQPVPNTQPDTTQPKNYMSAITAPTPPTSRRPSRLSWVRCRRSRVSGP